jgi:hypothetical protein
MFLRNSDVFLHYPSQTYKIRLVFTNFYKCYNGLIKFCLLKMHNHIEIR